MDPGRNGRMDQGRNRGIDPGNNGGMEREPRDGSRQEGWIQAGIPEQVWAGMGRNPRTDPALGPSSCAVCNAHLVRKACGIPPLISMEAVFCFLLFTLGSEPLTGRAACCVLLDTVCTCPWSHLLLQMFLHASKEHCYMRL